MTEILRRWTVALAVSGVCFTGWAEETEGEVPVVYPLYTVKTAGGTSSLSEVQISVVSEEGVDPVMKTIDEILPPDGGKVGGTFVKTGEGYLNSCANMTNYTGEIWIQQGALVLTGRGQLGPLNAGGIVRISDGASLGIDETVSLSSQNMYIGNTMYLRGTGYEGRGVIYNDSLTTTCAPAFMRARSISRMTRRSAGQVRSGATTPISMATSSTDTR